MNFKISAFLLGAVLTLSAAAADKLAVAEPVGKGGVQADEIETFWGILETSIHSNEYKLISRGALKQMLTEIGLTTSSDLVNLNSAQKAKLGQLEGVKYILVSEIGRFGSRLNCTLKILDSSTGEIDQMRTANIRVADLDELADKIEAELDKLLSDEKSLKRSAILTPVILVSGAPSYLAEDFNVRLEEKMIDQGIRLQSLKSVDKILRKNNIGNLTEVEPIMFRKIANLIAVDYLVQARINRFSCDRKREYLELSRSYVDRYLGNIEGNLRIMSGKDGEITGAIPFRVRVDFSDLDDDTEDWTAQDYGKYLIEKAVAEIAGKVKPKLKN